MEVSDHRLRLFLFFVGCLLLGCTANPGVSGPNQNSASAVAVPETSAGRSPQKDLARRDEVEAMMLRGEYHHDGPSELTRIGDIDSVPAILVVLKKLPPDKNGGMACTTDHALSALREITGANPGTTYEDWSAWWKKYKKSHPVSGRLEKAVDVTPN